MRILLINVAHPAIGSRIPGDHLPPLGLLAIAGPLLDNNHTVHLIDGELAPLSAEAIVRRAVAWKPEIVMFGHSGSTSGHPVITRVAGAVAAALPQVAIIYGGVYPTYHWQRILLTEPYVTAIVRGEGEETTVRLVEALENGAPLNAIPGIAFKQRGNAVATPAAPVILELDAYRIGWELIDMADYSYWGGKRAVVVQFSRGCPHLCTYCGQRGFWSRWRHRDPVRFAQELAWLHREHGVEVINFADENPTVSKKVWRAFLDALIAENVDLTLIGTTRADDIVRDADILHLYRQAGWTRFLLGLDALDAETLTRVKKGATPAVGREAIKLLRENRIISLASWVVGFGEETDRDFWRGLRQLLWYDPDQIQMMYATPHRWTPYFHEVSERRTIQRDQRRWDYKHQVLATDHVPPWRVLMWFKVTEALLQSRPKALRRTWLQRDPKLSHAMRWYTRIGRKVWPYEIVRFIVERRTGRGPTVREFWGADAAIDEFAMARPNRVDQVSSTPTPVSTFQP